MLFFVLERDTTDVETIKLVTENPRDLDCIAGREIISIDKYEEATYIKLAKLDAESYPSKTINTCCGINIEELEKLILLLITYGFVDFDTSFGDTVKLKELENRLIRKNAEDLVLRIKWEYWVDIYTSCLKAGLVNFDTQPKIKEICRRIERGD